MRLFAKFFLCATLVISISLLVSGYLLIITSYRNAISREVERALMQYQYDKFIMQANLITNAENFDVPQLTLGRLASELSGLTGFFDDEKELLYSDLPSQTDLSILDDISDNSHIYQFQTFGDESYIYVGGKLTQNDITLHLLIATDISSVIAGRQQMAQSFVRVYFSTLLISMAVIMVLSALITKPLKRMNAIAAAIARGRYNIRLPIKGSDEIGKLSDSFNRMADAIEDNINELEENARQKEDFVANFAHELKTPLTSVIGYADMLYQKDLTTEQVKDAAWYILSEGLRLEALSLKLMDLIVLNRRDFLFEEVSTEELFTYLAGGLKPVLNERKVSLHLKIQPAYVLIEHDLLKTLLLNLIDNSIKAKCKHIEIIGKQNGNRYNISVADNGKGIPASELNRITEAFYMVDKSRSRKQRNAGLGLALAARIAEIHGGVLTFKSEEGTGTIAKFDLAFKGDIDDE